MQSPEMMIKWRRELGPLLLLPDDQMSKRCGLEHHVPLLLANHDYSSVMESTATKLPFIGLCLAGLNLGRPSLHPQTLIRGLRTLWRHYVGSYQEHCWSCSMKLDKQTQDHKPLESVYKGKVMKELFVNGDIEEVYELLCVFINTSIIFC